MKIVNFNCDGLCSESTCNKKYTHFHIKKFHDVKILIPLCEYHYNEIEQIEYLKKFDNNNIDTELRKFRKENSEVLIE